MSKDFDLEDRLIEFAIRIIQLAESLPKTKAGNHISGQILRSGTSPAPNYGEAQAAESRSDFIHKLKVCLKEVRETKGGGKIMRKANLRRSDIQSLMKEKDELPVYSRDQIIVLLKADEEVPMGIVSDVKQKLRKANARRIIFAASWKGE